MTGLIAPMQTKTTLEEYFPLLRLRPVHNDLFDYQMSFPMQTFGFEASVRVNKEI